jgi:hypothetical protein
MTDAQPCADIAAEAARLIDCAVAEDVPVRLTGGLAVCLRAPNGEPRLRREYKDIDLVASRGSSSRVAEFLERMGYTPDRPFNTMNGDRRLLFYDTGNGRQVDVFVGSFEMCHVVPVADRIDAEAPTIPLAELLLTKLQIYELNEKDQRDILTILLDHEVGDADGDLVNGAYIARVVAQDWGLWRTSKLNVERTRGALGRYELTADERGRVAARLDELWRRVEAEPKPLRWRLRERLGDRVRWYEVPEEVG